MRRSKKLNSSDLAWAIRIAARSARERPDPNQVFINALLTAATFFDGAPDVPKLKHPEDCCHKCGRPNAVWFAPSPLWNKAVRERNEPEILCPVCFIRLADAAGIKAGVWKIAPADYQE